MAVINATLKIPQFDSSPKDCHKMMGVVTADEKEGSILVDGQSGILDCLLGLAEQEPMNDQFFKVEDVPPDIIPLHVLVCHGNNG